MKNLAKPAALSGGGILLAFFGIYLFSQFQIQPQPEKRPGTNASPQEERKEALQSYPIGFSIEAWGGVSFKHLPGSLIDIVSVVSDPDGETNSEVLLEKIRVLAVELDDKVYPPRKFTLEVTAAQAKKLDAARKRGKFRFILRPDEPPDEPTKVRKHGIKGEKLLRWLKEKTSAGK